MENTTTVESLRAEAHASGATLFITKNEPPTLPATARETDTQRHD